ncbi:hypothetical protein GNI_164620 [Gregarina niphandrodes]|uniref:Uncharacterized protein n=1 Tax=Gregarina niphandrodes TaxID=110365 RepID=A0A023AY72_GRENI|nr:hypothetical protein GNI_164620 [Gregarina niphandrodes]EZG43612.1 hypothetical protein GNI_164620 [Gregarina niphandrodes]|eukprot:XP_011133158.1 hypothetical protein GNI_164620 [Gregarina niphandrodes]
MGVDKLAVTCPPQLQRSGETEQQTAVQEQKPAQNVTVQSTVLEENGALKNAAVGNESMTDQAKFGPMARGNKREVLRSLSPDLDLALLVRLEPEIYVALQCDSHDSKLLLRRRSDAFVQAHGLNPVVASGLVKKCLIMMRKKDTLSEKKMLGTVRLKSTALLQYCVVDIISLF